MDMLGCVFDVKLFVDWRKVGAPEMKAHGGKSLLNQYGKVIDILMKVYPEFQWHPFNRSGMRNIWTPSIQEEFIKQMTDKFKISNESDWYRLSSKQLKRITNRHVPWDQLIHILRVNFPNISWDTKKFKRKNKRAQQRLLYAKILELFPNEQVIEEYNHKIITRQSGVSVKFDIFVPKYSLAFEYQGEQHYMDIPKAGFSALSQRQERDKEKEELCREHGITLITIPYWWDESLESIENSIREKHPSILLS